MGAAGAAGRGPGVEAAQTRAAPPKTAAETAARHAAAHRREQAPLAERRSLVRLDCDSGRCYQRDLLCAAGGGGIDAHGNGGSARSDRNQGVVLLLIQRSGQSLLRDDEGGGKGG